MLTKADNDSGKKWKEKNHKAVEVIKVLEQSYWNDYLPECSSRSNCNWYHSNGVFACKVCIYVENGKCDLIHT